MGKLFPAFQKLEGRRVVIVGGGDLAARKARLVAAPDVDLRLVWTCFSPAVVEEWAGRATMIDRSPVASDFDGAALAFVALDDELEAARFGAMAQSAGVPVNVVDRPEISDFFTPSIVDRGDVVVAISTTGAAPALAKRLRAQIETLLPRRLGALADFAKSFRGAVSGTLAPDRRRAFWERVFAGDIAATFLAGDEATARERMITSLNAPDAPPRGVVHIVGAGPGDPELLTLRALRLIQEADVILYDRLVGEGILDLARRDADRIFVGKAKADHAAPQDDINERMVALAGAGKIVVRLKGGDPFVFGRGGEELEALKAAGVDCHVTPGITAALGCAASAGAPLTHRDFAQAVTFVTGHAKGDAEPDLDWRSLAALRQTLVVYMGVETAPRISQRLVEAGMNAETPVAVIENGTRDDEKILTGTIAGLGDLVSTGDIAGPALLVIGETAAFARPTFTRDVARERRSA
ncbi:MAG: uroporphyrinogen-III C-methyltransferase [Alphaproteobacteria bacterium]|nr:uroporphyrinogen-III C-methyltransferase [Alphaproteobacteria bacterium]